MRLVTPMLALVLACGALARPANGPRAGDGGDEETSTEPPYDGPYTGPDLARVVRIGDVAVRPDGGEVAFTSDKNGGFELWTVSVDANGTAGEPRQRTRAKATVKDLAYAPDGSALAFVIEGSDERGDIWLLRRDAPLPERLTETDGRGERSVAFSPDARSITFEADPDRPYVFNLHTLELSSKRETRLQKDGVSTLFPRYTRDGKYVVATRSADRRHGNLVVVELATKTVVTIPAPHRGGIVYALGSFSDGRLLVRATNDDGFMQLAILELASHRSTFVGPGDWNVDVAKVSDAGAVVYVRNVHGESEVSVAQGPELRHERILSAGGVVDHVDIDAAGSAVVLSSESTRRPAEIFASDVATGHARTLVAAGLGRVKPDRLAPGTRREIKGEGGRTIDVFVHTPLDARLGKPLPAVVIAHDGPDAQARPRFDAMAQALAAAGLLVVTPNYRGSEGYGRALLDLNNKDWGGGDLKDLGLAVASLAEEGTLDRKRVGILGAGYGGYLALRAMTQAPERFRAAVDIGGTADLEEDYRLNEPRVGPWYRAEMGEPARDHALFFERSPVHFLDRIRGPLLVLQGAEDARVPKASTDALVALLKEKGREVDYVVYPNEAHTLVRRDDRADAMTRAVTFFGKALTP